MRKSYGAQPIRNAAETFFSWIFWFDQNMENDVNS